jgi:hypothetical protein
VVALLLSERERESWFDAHLRLGLELGIARRDDADDDTEQTQSTTKDFDDQNLDKEIGVLRIGQRTRSTNDSDTDAIARSETQQPSAEHTSRQ